MVNNRMERRTVLFFPSLADKREFVLENLAKMEGVSETQPKDSERIEVTFDPSRVDPSQIINSLREAGIEAGRAE